MRRCKCHLLDGADYCDCQSGGTLKVVVEKEDVGAGVMLGDLRNAELSDVVPWLEEHHGAWKDEAFGLWWTSRLARTLAVSNEPEDSEAFAIEVPKPGVYLVVRVSDD